MVCPMSGAIVCVCVWGVPSSSHSDLLAYQVLWRGEAEGVYDSFVLCAFNGFTPAKK